MPRIYVRESPTKPGQPEIILLPVLIRWRFKAPSGLRDIRCELQSVLLAWNGVGKATLSEILVAATSIVLEWVASGRAEVPDPDCRNCKAPFADHANEKKCLYGPTMYAPGGLELEELDFVPESICASK